MPGTDQTALLQTCLERLGFGASSQLHKALIGICGNSAWPTGNFLVMETVFLGLMGVPLSGSSMIRRRISDLNIKVRSEWLRNRDNPFPALYVYRFHSPTDHLHYVLTLFEPSLAEHLVINFLDDKEESATERGASQHAGVRRILEKYFGCALQHLHRKGRPLRQGTWRIPFGRGTLSREQVRSELERRILAYLPQPSRDEDSMVSRRPRQKAGESEAGTPPRFLGLWGAPGIGKTYLLNKMARSVILRMHFGRGCVR